MFVIHQCRIVYHLTNCNQVCHINEKLTTTLIGLLSVFSCVWMVGI
jgi:hypothetical protein